MLEYEQNKLELHGLEKNIDDLVRSPSFFENETEQSVKANAQNNTESVCNKVGNIKGAYCKNELTHLQYKACDSACEDRLFYRRIKHPEIKPKGNEYDNIQYNFPKMKPSNVVGIIKGDEIYRPLTRKREHVGK